MDIAFIHDRFRELKQQRKFKSARVIAESMQINRHTINKILSGDVRSERDKILFRAVLNHIGVSENAFFKRPETAKPVIAESKTVVLEAPRETVPLLGAIPAGHAVPTDGLIESDVQIGLPPGLKKKNLFALTVQGMSMQPYLESGDLVYLEPLGYGIGPLDPENPAPKSYFDRLHGRIVAVVHNGDATLKLLQVQPLGKGQFNLYLMPINRDFDPIHITDKCDVLFQGVVVSVVRDASRSLHNHMRELPNAN